MNYCFLSEILSGYADFPNCYAIIVEKKPESNHGINDGSSLQTLVIQDSKRIEVDLTIRCHDSSQQPDIESPGDIIRIVGATVRVSPETKKKELFLDVSDGLRPSQFSVFRGSNYDLSSPYLPYDSSQNSPPLNASMDHQLIDVLRNWLRFSPVRPSTKGSSSHREMCSNMASIREGLKSSLFCKILHTQKIDKNKNNSWVIFVWDGTDVPLVPLLKREETLGDLEGLWKKPLFDIPTPSEEASLQFPGLGTVLPLEIPPSKNKILNREGCWAQLKNIDFFVVDNTLMGKLLEDSDFEIVESTHWKVRDLELMYEKRLASGDEDVIFCQAGIARCQLSPTVVDHESEPRSSIREILQSKHHPEHYRCLARVVGVFPPDVSEFLTLVEKVNNPGTHIGLRLTLEDYTGRMHATLSKNDAAYFIGTNVHSLDTSLGSFFQSKVDTFGGKLIPKGDTFDPPWIHICILSFLVKCSRNGPPRPRYKIFGTRLRI